MSWNKLALKFNAYEAFGHDEAIKIADEARRVWDESGALPGEASVLRCCLFCEQRRWHFDGYEPEGANRRYIDQLVRRIKHTRDGQDVLIEVLRRAYGRNEESDSAVLGPAAS